MFEIKTKQKKKKNIPKTVQQSIPIDEFFENGMICTNNTYSICARFENCDYLLAREEIQQSIFNNYCDLLNSLDVKFQLFLSNVNPNKQDLYDAVLTEKNDMNKDYSETLDDLNKILKNKIDQFHENTARKEFYLVLSVDSISGKSVYTKLTRALNEIERNFSKIGSKVQKLELEEYVELLYYFYHPNRVEKKDFIYPENFNGKTIKDIISPSSFFFRPSFVEMGTTYRRFLFIKDLPVSIRDNFIANLLECPFTLSISLHIEPVDPTKAISSIRRRITGMESNKIQYKQKGGLTLNPYVPYDLEYSLDESRKLLDSIVKQNKKLFYMGFYISIASDSKDKLNERTEIIESVCKKYLVKSEVITHRQEDGMTSTMPIGKDLIKIKRTLLTDSTAIFLPFSSQEVIHRDGFYYGISKISNGMMVINRRNLDNPAGFFLGVPRSGKSMSAKKEIANIILKTSDDVIVVDPEGEYGKLCQNFKGEIINISAGTKNHINPLEMSKEYGAGENPIKMKSEFVLSFFESLVGNLNPIEKTIIDRTVKSIYGKYVSENYDERYLPTMQTLHRQLLNQQEQEAKNLAVSMELYVKGSLNMFAQKTNINLKNRFTVFDTKELGKQLKTLGMLIILDYIWNRVCYNWANKKRTWIYIDEFYMLFENEYTSSFFNEFFKRSQKRGGIPTGITQNVQEVLVSDMAKNMLSNSEFITLFRQSPSDKQRLKELLTLSDEHLGYVTDSSAGAGLMIMKGKLYPFEDKFPTDSLLYRMITTKVQDLFGGEVNA